MIRIRGSSVAEAYFNAVRDEVRRKHPEAKVLPGDAGRRQVLTAWIKERIREEVG